MKRYMIQNLDLGVDYRDHGVWRSYELTAECNSLAELIDSAIISEIDQDGGEIDAYGIEFASQEVALAALRAIERVIGEVAKKEQADSVIGI